MNSDDTISKRLKRFHDSQSERLVNNLEHANKKLKMETQVLKGEVLKTKEILDFHYRLEKDFFSADSLEELIIRLINCLLINLDLSFVSLCFNKQYLESMLGSRGFEQLIPDVKTATKVGYLTVIEEPEFKNYFGQYNKTVIQKTPRGSSDIFFPEHGDEVRSQAILPLVIHNQKIGCLNLGSILNMYDYHTNADKNLLDRLAVKLAIAIDNILSRKKLAFQKEILDRDIERAAIFQSSLLPNKTFHSASVEVINYFIPCQKLGGDFFDVIPFSSEKIAIVIADVVGHGMSAALIAAMLKFSLQMDDIENYSPNEMIAKINQKFCQIFKNEDYITLCYAIVNTHNGHVNLIRAGHPYPIFFGTLSENPMPLTPAGPPLGLSNDAVYENIELKLSSGDMLFFYTDGLIDSLFGVGQFKKFGEHLSFLSRKFGRDRIIQRFLVNIDECIQDKELDDDISVLIVKMN